MSIAPSQNPLEAYLEELVTLTESMLELQLEELETIEACMEKRQALVEKVEETILKFPEASKEAGPKALLAALKKLDEALEKRFLEIKSSIAKEIHKTGQNRQVVTGYMLGRSNKVNLGIENEA